MGHGASGCFAYIGPPNGPISIRAVHSSPFPPCGAARRRGRARRGGPGGPWVGGPRARSRTPPTSAPFAKKSRFQDVIPFEQKEPAITCSGPPSARVLLVRAHLLHDISTGVFGRAYLEIRAAYFTH
jgi:hypothetical protein